MNTILDLGTGKMSTFGGPEDTDMGVDEGLALLFASDVNVWPFHPLFLPYQPKGTTGLGRRLNPDAWYFAMRWDEVLKPFGLEYFTNSKRNLDTTAMLRRAVGRISNPLTGAALFAKPVDYGPGDGKVVDGKTDPDTERLGDLSPRTALFLGLAPTISHGLN